MDTIIPRANITGALASTEAAMRSASYMLAPLDQHNDYDAFHALTSAVDKLTNAIRALRAARDLLEATESL